MGSFLGLVSYRLPRHESIVSGRSQCEVCHCQLRWYELIPVLSYLWLHGQCRSCHSSISKKYPIIELVSAAIVLSSFYRWSLSFEFIEACVFLLLMLKIFIVDWEYLIIPNTIVLVGAILGLTFHIIHGLESLVPGLIGGAVALVLLFSIRLIGNMLYHKETMGLGDVKLAGALGVWLGVTNFLLAFWFAVVFGAIYGLWKTKFQKYETQKQSFSMDIVTNNLGALNIKIPFGSFLAIAASGVFWHQQTLSQLLRIWWNFNQ